MSPQLRHILLVEDDADIRSIVTLALTAFGSYEVVAVEDGASAIDAATRQAPDLAILDYMMPGMNGLEVLSALRSTTGMSRELPCIFLTAAVSSQTSGSLRVPGVLGVIAKPFDAVGLAGEVQRLWDAHHAAL